MYFIANLCINIIEGWDMVFFFKLYESDDVVAFHCDVVQHTLLHYNFAVAVAIDVEMAGSPETIGVHIAKIFDVCDILFGLVFKFGINHCGSEGWSNCLFDCTDCIC
jgi:hypothetical protein